jgi:hypothetical protein
MMGVNFSNIAYGSASLPLCFALGPAFRVRVRTGRETAGPSTTLRSGRDDNSVGRLTAIRLTAFEAFSMQQNCHPDRSVPGFPASRHSSAATCAALSEESRMQFANATNLNRKSGVA